MPVSGGSRRHAELAEVGIIIDEHPGLPCAETLATAVQVQWGAEAGLRALHRSTPLEDRATWQPALHASERAVALEQPTRVVERGLGIEL